MTKVSRSLILFVIVVIVTALVPIFGCPRGGQGQSNLTSRVQALEAAVASLQTNLAAAEAKLAFVSVEQGTMNGVNGPHVIFEDCNVHVRSGSGETDDSAGLTGLGNFIIGYNEQPNPVVYGRLGSHNLIVGMAHEYNNYGGMVAGEGNKLAAAAASVSGGRANVASGSSASVSGGSDNVASALAASVSGGTGNDATGTFASASGGSGNTASGQSSSVTGGGANTASATVSSVSGGSSRTAAGFSNWVAGALSQAN